MTSSASMFPGKLMNFRRKKEENFIPTIHLSDQ